VWQPTIFDCANVRDVFGIDSGDLPTHGGYHYSSTAIEWYKLLGAMRDYEETGAWHPLVSLEDGMRAVEIGLQATQAIVNDEPEEPIESATDAEKESMMVIVPPPSISTGAKSVDTFCDNDPVSKDPGLTA